METDQNDQIIGIEPGATLFKEGEEGNDIYILMNGAFEISRNERPLNEVKEVGSFLGEIEALIGERRSTTATAKTYCRVLHLPLPFEKVLAAHKKLLPKLLQNLEERRLFTEQRIRVHEAEIWGRCLDLFLSLYGIRFLSKNPKGDVRRESYLMRLRIEDAQKHSANPYDPNILFRLSQDHGLYENFLRMLEERVGQFKPFEFSSPSVNARNVNTNNVEETLEAARTVARQIIEATNHLAALELTSHLEGLEQDLLSELERSLKPEILIELMNDLFLTHCCRGVSVEEIARERKRFNVQTEAALEGIRRQQEGASLLSVAKAFNLEEPYREKISDLVAIYTASEVDEAKKKKGPSA